jgi:hypothetical protein
MIKRLAPTAVPLVPKAAFQGADWSKDAERDPDAPHMDAGATRPLYDPLIDFLQRQLTLFDHDHLHSPTAARCAIPRTALHLPAVVALIEGELALVICHAPIVD